jgi:hypothetical protein
MYICKLPQRIMDKMENDGRKAMQIPWKYETVQRIYTPEYHTFLNLVQMDKNRYGTSKDGKTREEKIPFTITKVGTNDTESLAIQIMDEHENQTYRRLSEIQKQIKSEEKEKKEKIIRRLLVWKRSIMKKLRGKRSEIQVKYPKKVRK